MPKLVIETELDTKTYDRQIAQLKSDLERYIRVLESDAQVPVSLKMSEQERQNLEVTIEKIRNQLVGLEQQAQKTGQVGEESGEQSGRGFEKAISSLKRFALSLFGIRGMFTLVRRATSSYLSEHEQTANKINAIWVALGNALGPIIEIIANMVLKLVGYLNVFLQALGFDVDLTKGMNKSKKAIEGTTGAMKELNNQVASFDEMNVAQKETSSGGLGGGDGLGDASGFEMPELNQDVVKFLQDTAKWLKENWQLVLLLGGALAGLKVAGFLSKLGSLIGSASGNGTGLLGLSNVLKSILAMELITITISVVYYGKQLNDLKNDNKEIEKFAHNNTETAKEVNKSNLDVAKSYEKGSEEIRQYVTELNNQIQDAKNDIEVKKKQNSKVQGLNKVWDAFGGTTSKNNALIKESTQRLINNALNLQELAREGKLTDEQMNVYNETMKYLNETQNELGDYLNENKTNMMTFGTSVFETDIKLYEQIDALKKADSTMQTSTNNQKNAYGSLTDKILSDIRRMDGATATTQITADATQFQNTLNKIGNVTGIQNVLGVGLTNAFKFFRLATGGIVYNPGRGVPLVGEATGGPEGVVPLNNEQSMDLIGQSIARHLVVNLTNTTTLDGKVIAREQKKIETENNFATNGRGV